jgi:FeS assembly protein IscX
VNWTDTYDIAIALSEKYPEVTPLSIRFTDLHRWVLELESFLGKKDQCNEKILEAIQMAWLDEVQ